jgi:hypothetical protein
LFFFFFFFSENGISWIICQGWPWSMILPISASQVARITGVSHWHPAITKYFLKHTKPKNLPRTLNLGWVLRLVWEILAKIVVCMVSGRSKC